MKSANKNMLMHGNYKYIGIWRVTQLHDGTFFFLIFFPKKFQLNPSQNPDL